MNKKEVLASIIELANELDSIGAHKDADALTNVGERLAQWDDDFGGDFDDQDRFERHDDYNVWEERQLAEDERLERQSEDGGTYTDMDDAITAIRQSQAEYGNVPYMLLRDIDTDDDRNTTFNIMPFDKYESEGSYFEGFRRIEPGTQEELAPYMRDFETETPLGMELDGGSDIDFDY